MTFMTNKKSRIFVVLLKFNYGKVVPFHEHAKLFVVVVASRARNSCMIVKVSG